MKTKQESWCNQQQLKDLSELADFLKIIADKNRLRIICFLAKKGEQCVCEIFKALGLTQNLTSHHLKKLRDHSLLNERKEGVFVFYSVNQQALKKYEKLFKQVIKK